MKPILPPEISRIFPPEVVHLMYSFLSHEPKQEKTSPHLSYTRELQSLVKKPLEGLDELFFRDTEEYTQVEVLPDLKVKLRKKRK